MGKKIFTLILISLLIMAAANAQMSFSRKKASQPEKKLNKNPHWEFSDYRPATNKRAAKKQQSILKSIMTGTYRNKNLSFKERQKIKESKVKKKRLSRIKGQKNTIQAKKNKFNRRDAESKYWEREERRADRVNRNKGTYSTKAMIKKNRTVKGFDLPPFNKRIKIPA